MARYLDRQNDLGPGEKKMLHSLGADRRRTYVRYEKEFFRPYRNCYSTGKNGDKDLDKMVGLGYVKKKEEKGIYTRIWYFVTDEGRLYLQHLTGCKIYPEEE